MMRVLMRPSRWWLAVHVAGSKPYFLIVYKNRYNALEKSFLALFLPLKLMCTKRVQNVYKTCTEASWSGNKTFLCYQFKPTAHNDLLSSLSLGRRFVEANIASAFLAGMNRNPNTTDGSSIQPRG